MKNLMRPLWLDYLRQKSGDQWPGLFLLIGSVLLCGLFLAQSISISEQTTVIEQEIARLKYQAERRLIGGTDEAAMGKPAHSQDKGLPFTTPWESLLLALEQTMDESITLLGLEPGTSEIAISGEARDINALLDYIKRLQSLNIFVDVRLIKHEIIKESPYQPLRFSLLATWRELLK